ncbi:hypothetical protein K474DRAFT_1712536 [Panus rudis PR-1116 ss-1]|nr:hypothetical protein K474DRAFT_1712536 [Panus rudis PR-1116 ss-1]
MACQTYPEGMKWAILEGRKLPAASHGLVPSWFKSCGSDFSEEQAHYLAISWSMAIAFDFVIFALTLFKRLRVGRTIKDTLLSLMIRDGTLYFGFLTCLYIVNLISILKYRVIVEISTLINAVATTLVSRLMLNIRDPRNASVFSQDTTKGTTSGTAPAFFHSTTSDATSSEVEEYV